MRLNLLYFTAFCLVGISSLNDNQRNNTGYLPQKENQSCTNLQTCSNTENQLKPFSPENEISYAQAVENIKSDEYNITFSGELNSYQSPNRSNNLRFVYYKDGFNASVRETKIALSDRNDRANPDAEIEYKTIPYWEINFKLNGYNKGEVNSAFSGNKIKVEKNNASVEDENIIIKYNNSKAGMRQDFIVKNKPEGHDNLKLEISAETELKMNVNKNEISFCGRDGTEQMKYSDLKVWDAEGKALDAYFESNQKQDLFAVVVNDENAVYPVTIDPISNSPNWTARGNQADAAFGKSVSSAGDVNNDGYSDIIIGAPFYDNGQTDEGKAFVFLGSAAGLLPVPVWTAESNQAYSQFGWCVSKAGDVNGDGFCDVIVGANQHDNDQVDEGRAYVFFGNATGVSPVANWTVESNQSGSQFGWTVAAAGNVNNDAYADILVGAPLYDSALTDRGRVFVYYGSASGPSATANWKAESDQATSFFGITGCGAGDVNGDGFSDIVIGANRYDNPLMDEGGAFLYYGSSTGLSNTVGWHSESHLNAFFAYYGISVASAGDVNGDGFSDIIVGSYADDNGQTDEGKVYVYYGSQTGFPATASWTAESDQAYARFGYSVSSAGDVNGDGYSDIIVGAREYDDGEINEGAAFVYCGSANGLSSVNYVAQCNQENALFGCSVASAGKINGDNYSDIIIGAYTYDDVFANEGKVFVYHGTPIGAKFLSLTMFIQGFYNQNNNLMKLDSASVTLRSTISPYNAVDFSKAIVTTSGTGIFSFQNASNGIDYYIQLKHRNSIETWSSVGKSFVNNAMSYDFSTSESQAYGNNMKQVDSSPVRFAIYGADVNQDGSVEAGDLSVIDNDAYNFVSGYVMSDVDGSNFVDATDAAITDNNAFNFITCIKP